MARTINFKGYSDLVQIPDPEIAQVAQDIAILRGEAITEALILASVVRHLPGGTASSTDLIRCQAAAVQSMSASGGYQAAHLLPGQITVNGSYLWKLADPNKVPITLRSPVIALQSQIEMAFADTRKLPACFNRADSEAEGRSDVPERLKDEFGKALGTLWQRAGNFQNNDLIVDMKALKAGMESWFQSCNRIYSDASNRKKTKAMQASGAKKAEREKEALVLKTYADSFLVVNVMRFLNSGISATLISRYRRVD